MRVVLIDDNEADLRMLEQRLRGRGHDVDCFRIGADAVDHMRRHVGDITMVISDERMAHMSGSDVAQALRHEGLLDGVRFILFSGHPTASFIGEMGVERHTKPEDMHGLDAWLDTIVGA